MGDPLCSGVPRVGLFGCATCHVLAQLLGAVLCCDEAPGLTSMATHCGRIPILAPAAVAWFEQVEKKVFENVALFKRETESGKRECSGRSGGCQSMPQLRSVQTAAGMLLHLPPPSAHPFTLCLSFPFLPLNSRSQEGGRPAVRVL